MGLDSDLPDLVKQFEAAKGVQCLVYTNRQNPTLTVHGSIRAGMAAEPPESGGLAELTSRLLVRGTTKMGSAKFANIVESVGAVASFRNTQDNITFHAKMTTEWKKTVLGAVGECLAHPVFRTKDLEKEREQLLTDIRLRDEDTTRRGLRELNEAIYPENHPYRRDKHGTPQTVKTISREQIQDYFEKTVSNAPVTISFAGDIEPQDAVKWAEKVFPSRHTAIEATSFPEAGERMTSVSRTILMEHKSQADIVMGCLACERGNPDYEPLNLLNVIVGELGFMGRLGQRVRDQEGLAYSATSFLIAGLLGGNWAAISGVNPRNLEKATNLIKEEVGRVQYEPVSTDELDSSKRNQIGSAMMELESTEGVARTSHNLANYGLGLDYFSKRKVIYQNIGPADLMRVAKKYLDPAKLSTIIVGPKIRV